MKKLLITLVAVVAAQHGFSQLKLNYDPAAQPTTAMQYFTPKGKELFVGDCIPFSHKGTYYLYWLLDSAHHSALNGLGGHQWAVSTTTDLKTWKHYPVVIGVDEEWEKSICTGSVVYHNNKFYAFYATRLLEDGKVNEQLSYAVSDDGIHFEKQKPNPFYTSAPGYSKRDFRDPKVFVDKDGVFHLFVSSRTETPAIKKWDGTMVHMTSKDLKTWDVKTPVLYGQGSTPECPDYFKWNNYYYLIYSHDGDTHYVKSKNPYGPWEQPDHQALIEDWSNVAKTAEFTNNRRIAASWVPSKHENKDNGRERFGGATLFRELTQTANGTLNTKFPPEMIPPTDAPLKLEYKGDSTFKKAAEGFILNSANGVGAVKTTIPTDVRITFEAEIKGPYEEFGLILHSNEDGSSGYRLTLSANDQTAQLHESRIYSVKGLYKKVKIDVIMKDDFIDVDIDNRRTLVNRLPEHKGNTIWFFVKHGSIEFKKVTISPLTKK